MESRPPRPSSENARRTMLANRRKDTSPELAVRRRIHAAGLRYRVDFPADAADRRRRADIVFTRVKVVVFIDGCFWHGCPQHFIAPKSNADYWGPKIARNIERDRTSTARLSDAGWRVLRFWEHEDPEDVATRIIDAVRPRNRILPPDVSHRR
ncbi:very short patch repair endonuclease [Brachybacterium sp. EE-P12]|uniref:very short patch repair endonuclease n=1 Tax=Brachybacterium sp. EE-P12 TaxID=2306299 RepID=UPI000F0949D6|nr:very short patch repair endonuclease [Brachybacterium sp. EE-P12]